jgi:hypothetical protein
VKANLEALRVDRSYKATDGCQAELVTTRAAREACERFRMLEGELETANAAQILEGKAATLTTTLAKAPAIQQANPQAAALSILLHVSMEDAVSLYAFAASLALELAAIAAMMRADSRPASHRPPNMPDREPLGEMSDISEERVPTGIHAGNALPKRPRLTGGTALVYPPTQPPGADTVGRFMLACLKRAPGEEAAAGAIYARYTRWCSEQQPAAAAQDLRSFAQQFAQRCERVGILTRRDGHRVYCLDVELVA